jgi:hypothetical protein
MTPPVKEAVDVVYSRLAGGLGMEVFSAPEQRPVALLYDRIHR